MREYDHALARTGIQAARIRCACRAWRSCAPGQQRQSSCRRSSPSSRSTGFAYRDADLERVVIRSRAASDQATASWRVSALPGASAAVRRDRLYRADVDTPSAAPRRDPAATKVPLRTPVARTPEHRVSGTGRGVHPGRAATRARLCQMRWLPVILSFARHFQAHACRLPRSAARRHCLRLQAHPELLARGEKDL